MRWVGIFSVVVVSLMSTVAAQTPSRWTFSAGPEWSQSRSLWGLRLRADYDLLNQASPFQLRLQGGARWGPTQYFQGSYFIGGSYTGEDQTVDLTLGVVAAISPLPRARFSPYVTVGALARQAWSRGWTMYWDSSGSPTGSTIPRTSTYGDVIFPVGVGMRARLGGRVFQLEVRRLPFNGVTNSVMLGTSLPF